MYDFDANDNEGGAQCYDQMMFMRVSLWMVLLEHGAVAVRVQRRNTMYS